MLVEAMCTLLLSYSNRHAPLSSAWLERLDVDKRVRGEAERARSFIRDEGRAEVVVSVAAGEDELLRLEKIRNISRSERGHLFC